MIPLRKNVALAVDGGGVRGVIVTRALSILEDFTGMGCRNIFGLTAGTSTGAVISAGIGAGLTATRLFQLYTELSGTIFRRSLRSRLWPLFHYRYSGQAVEDTFRKYAGDIRMGDLWAAGARIDVVITTFDLLENRTRFIKPWKVEYADWLVAKAALASSTVPTYFPPVEGRYIDGGVGAYANPCYVAAFEMANILEWDPAETTLISLGTGRGPHHYTSGEANHWWAWDWLEPIMGAFMRSADDQQVHLASTFFPQLDFRRIQINLRRDIAMDDPSAISELTAYGDAMGSKLLNDEVEPAPDFRNVRPRSGDGR